MGASSLIWDKRQRRRAFLYRCLLLLPALILPHASVQAALILQSSSPAHGAANAPAHGPFTLTFNEPVRLSSFVQSLPHLPSFSSPTLRLSPATGAGGAPISWTLSLSANRRTVTLTPSVPLAEGVFYQLYVSRKGDLYPVKQDNSASTILSADAGTTNPIIFTVKDAVPPEVRDRFPYDGAEGLPVNTRLQILASEPLDPATVRLTLNGTPVSPQAESYGLHWTAALSLQPSTRYTAEFAGADVAGNPFPPVSWSFATGPSAEPDAQPPAITGASPPPGAVNVPPTVQPSVTFSERISLVAGSVLLVKCEGGEAVPGIGWTLSPDGRTLTALPPTLEAGPTCYDLRISATDAAGNPLPPPGSPGNRLTFTTADLTPPVLTGVIPAPGATVHPVTGPDLAFRFSEDLRTSGADAPVLKLAYASGSPPPVLDPRDAVSLGGGRWRLEGQGWASPRDLVLRVLPSGASGERYLPGDRLFIHLESAMDAAGNALGAGAVPNPWSFTTVETRSAELLEVTPAEGALAALDAPVALRFSRAMDLSRLRFEADGDWSPTATEILDGTKSYSPRRWLSNSTAWDADRRIATLRHALFEESPPETTLPHALRILSMPDAQGKEATLGAGQSAVRNWLTGYRPRVVSAEYLAPAQPSADLTPGGLLANPDDPSRTVWRPLADGTELPLNTRLRLRFSAPMSSTTWGVPALSPAPPDAALTPEDATTARIAFSAPLNPTERRYARSPEGALLPAPSPLTLTLSAGASAAGDPLIPYTVALYPVDTRPPGFRIEVRAGGGSSGQPPEWRPLEGATIPPDAPWRIVADETLSAVQAVTLERDGESGPDPSAADPQFSERGDAEERVGNVIEVGWSKPLATTEMAAPGREVVEGKIRVKVRDTRTLPAPNVTEKTVAFRVTVPRRLLPGDLDGNGVFDARDVDLALNAYLSRTPLSPEALRAADLIPPGGDGRLDPRDLNALMRLLLHGTS
ncbi:MAG: Ig-like domain-containing protein [Armatimonadetes bacterium]|nr:Ig-like domain-containing protein [Armatimonadota bacterium]